MIIIIILIINIIINETISCSWSFLHTVVICLLSSSTDRSHFILFVRFYMAVFHPVASLWVSKTRQLTSALLLFHRPNKQGSLPTWTTKFLAPGRRYLRRWWRVCRGWSTEGTIQQVRHEDAHTRARAHRCTRAQSTPWQHLCCAFQPSRTDFILSRTPNAGRFLAFILSRLLKWRGDERTEGKNKCIDHVLYVTAACYTSEEVQMSADILLPESVCWSCTDTVDVSRCDEQEILNRSSTFIRMVLFTSAFVMPWQKYKCHWGRVSLTGIAVDGPSKISNNITGNQICLIKKTGKVKALDEELYSEFIHLAPEFVMSANCPTYWLLPTFAASWYSLHFNLPEAIMRDEVILTLEINNEDFHSSSAPSIHFMLIETMTKPLFHGCSHRERFTEPGRGAPHTLRPGSHPLGHARRAQRCQQPPPSLGQRQRCGRSLPLLSSFFTAMFGSLMHGLPLTVCRHCKWPTRPPVEMNVNMVCLMYLGFVPRFIA